MDAYSGFEPQVGEVRAVRSYRIGRDGSLYPLFSEEPWTDGVNTARCRSASRPGPGQSEHLVVDPDCTCGFYAYANEHAAAEYPHSRHVLVVVAGWGRIVAGTRGLRGQYARIEAIWMSATVPQTLTATVTERYPSAVVYSDKATMLAEHPPTWLDCYETPNPRERLGTRVALRAAFVVTLILGLLPWHWLTGNLDAFALWATAVCAFLVAAVGYGRSSEVVARKRAVICSATVLWLIAPLAGPAGFLFLRLPVLEIAVLTYRHRARLERVASHFPAQIG